MERKRSAGAERPDTIDHSDGRTTFLGAGESYRPAAHARSPPRRVSPQRIDTFRSRDRSPPRRARSPVVDSYHPGDRRRSRTPPYRRERPSARDSSDWRSRARSPPRARSPARGRTPPRRYSPRRERDDDRRERIRSPRRDERRRSRSPYDRDRATRARSPVRPRRSRSPPAGPRESWRARSRSPRRDAPAGPSSSNWRRRSPTPAAERSSGRTSTSTSRRSSPHVHQSRLAHTQGAIGGPRARSPPSRARSPPPRPRSPPLVQRERESARSTPRERSPVRPVIASVAIAKSPPRGPSAYANRAPPSGPSRNFAPAARSPIIPSTVAPVRSSREEIPGPSAPPTGPRAYAAPVRGGYLGRGSGRGSFGSSSTWGAAPTRPALDVSRSPTASRAPPPASPSIPSTPSTPSVPTGPSGGIPTGPRAGIPSRPSLQHSSSAYGSRPSVSSQSGPRPHPAMANLPQILPGGRIDPTAGYPPDVTKRMKKLEDEAEVLYAKYHAEQDKLRQDLKAWDRLQRESEAAALRSELSERHVRSLAGEGVGGAAF